ncbi:MAG: helix-turn-helix transcriptional regulator [Planctomycetia bacterium]
MPSRPSASPAKNASAGRPPAWTFLTNHGHVLVCIAQHGDIRISEIADLVGIGERTTHRIVCDLVDGGFVVRKKDGRRNTYAVNYEQSLRHPLESAYSIGDVFGALSGTSRRNAKKG